MSAPEHPAWLLIEPEAIIASDRSRGFAPGEHTIELSKAISLKRISDALDLGREDSVAHTVWLMAMQGSLKR